MPNFNELKTTNDGYFPKSGGIACWDLSFSANVWNTLVDFIAILWAFFFRAEATATITVTSSPFTYTAGTESEVVYVRGGSVSAIEKKDSAGSWVSVLDSSNATVFLASGQQMRVTYASAPTMTSDVVGMFVNATSATAALTPSSSPWTISNDENRTVVLYISGGSITSITRNGISITDAVPLSVVLPPSAEVIITYTSAPDVVQDS